MRRPAAAWVVALCLSLGAPAHAVDTELLTFDAFDGWDEDNHAAALATFRNTCPDLETDTWGAICAFASSDPDPRSFFELFFRPVRVGGSAPAHFTGYFEPELPAAREKGDGFEYPVYRRPPALETGEAWLTRAEIENGDRMKGHEIAWLRDPVDLYFLQIQGSGRLVLTDGTTLRLGYDGSNGHPFRPVSSVMVSRDIYEPHQVSSKVIRNWVRRNPERGRALLHEDPSYVFFRVLDGRSQDSGPLGALNRPLTAGRSLAVDPEHIPLGAPVWIEKDGAIPMRRLMVAQDTGGAIKGPRRADIFFGTGADADDRASRVRDPGRMVVLMPIERAYAMRGGG